MYLKWFGVALLFISILIAGLIATAFKTPTRKYDYAATYDANQKVYIPIVDQTVSVPPLNSSKGWVGFNVTLPNKQKDSYRAYGVILPADNDSNPFVQMRAVNNTGLNQLLFDQFDPNSTVWNETKQYATAYLDNKTLYMQFDFHDLDNCTEYIMLFRGGKQENINRPILISVKESWIDQRTLLEPTTLNASLAVVPGIIGLCAYIYDRRSKSSRNRQRHQRIDKNKPPTRTH